MRYACNSRTPNGLEKTSAIPFICICFNFTKDDDIFSIQIIWGPVIELHSIMTDINIVLINISFVDFDKYSNDNTYLSGVLASWLYIRTLYCVVVNILILVDLYIHPIKQLKTQPLPKNTDLISIFVAADQLTNAFLVCPTYITAEQTLLGIIIKRRIIPTVCKIASLIATVSGVSIFTIYKQCWFCLLREHFPLKTFQYAF